MARKKQGRRTEVRRAAAQSPNSQSATLFICAALIGLTWFVFGQTRSFPFINYDDPGYVTANSNVLAGLSAEGFVWAFTGTHGANWHPLTSLSHMLDCQLFGLWAGGHHLMNVVLQAVAAICCFLVLRQLTGPIWRSAFVAAVFAVHPLRVESVAWISERKDMLSGIFFLLALGAYNRYARKPSAGRYAAVALLFALGLLCKPIVIMLPFVLLLVDYWPLRRVVDLKTARKCAIEKLPLIVLSIASAALTIRAQQAALESVEAISLPARLANACVSYLIYIRQMFWSTDLAVLYPHPGEHLPVSHVVFSAAVLLAVSLLAIAGRKRFPYVYTGWFWYLIILLPVIGITQAGLQARADRYTYLPHIGLSLLVAWGANDLLARWRFRRAALAVAALIVVSALSWSAHAQTRHWRESETLWRHTLAVTTNNDVAHVNLAAILLDNGRAAEAIPHCEAAIKIWPTSVEAHNNLGLACFRTGDDRRAAAAWRRSVQLRPSGVKTEIQLAWLLATSPSDSVRNGAEAVSLAQAASEQTNYSDLSALRTLAAAYAEAGNFDEAVRVAESASALAVRQNQAALSEELQFHARSYRAHLQLRDSNRGAKSDAPQATE